MVAICRCCNVIRQRSAGPSPGKLDGLWLMQAVIVLGSLLATITPATADTVVVRPKAFAGSLQAWMAYRKSQGHAIAEVDAELGAAGIKEAITTLHAQRPLRHIVLAGDVHVGVHTFYHPSTALVQFGGPATLASDNDYGDVDNDGSPEIAVGRIPAQTTAQLASYLDRVIAYEKNSDFSPWRRDVHIVAGVGGFGVVTDGVIEMTTRRFLSDAIPNWVNLTMTQASLTSNYCPDPCLFCDAAVDRLNDGGAFWVYIGHGWVNQLDTIRVGDDRHPILTMDHLPSIKVRQPPIAIFLACYTGAFDAREDCLAERLVLSETGPIAAIAATRVSGPYGLAVLSDGLLNGYFEKHRESLGELFLQSKQASLDDSQFDETAEAKGQLAMINSIASAMSPRDYDLRAERQEHVWQVNLLGDPLMRLAHGADLPVQLDQPEILAGESVRVTVQAPEPGKLSVELATRRGVPSPQVRNIKVDSTTDDGRHGYSQRYQAANEQTIVQVERAVQPQTVVVEVKIPDNLRPGRYVLREYLQSPTGFHVSCQEIVVKPSLAK